MPSRRSFLTTAGGLAALGAAGPALGPVPGRDLGRRRDAAADRDRAASATRTSAPQTHRRRSCAPTSSAAALFRAVDAARRALDETQPRRPAPMARSAAPTRSSRGSVDAPGRRPLRRALPALGRGQGQRPRRPEQRRRRPATCGSRRTASPTTSTRSSPARRACSRPASPTSRKAGSRYTLRVADADGENGAVGAHQRRADHLAGVVARRQAARLRLVRDAEGGGLRARRRQRRAPR